MRLKILEILKSDEIEYSDLMKNFQDEKLLTVITLIKLERERMIERRTVGCLVYFKLKSNEKI